MLHPQPQNGQMVDTIAAVVPLYGRFFSINAPVGQIATQVPQNVHSDFSSGSSFSVAGFEVNPRLIYSMAPWTTSSWSALMHLAQRMHLLKSLSMKGLTSSMVASWGIFTSSIKPTSISEAILRSSQRLPLSHTRQVSG